MIVTAYHFWSPTCAPCKAIKPSIDELKEEFSNVGWVSVNTHADTDSLALKYNVRVVPTIVVVASDENNEEFSRDSHSGTGIAGYYRILRNGLRATKLS
jgi:thiol-disulfide isomerase/thioredoxin